MDQPSIEKQYFDRMKEFSENVEYYYQIQCNCIKLEYSKYKK